MSERDYAREPVRTADGKPWVQRCFICGKSVNFIKGELYVKVSDLVRHKHCLPEPAR